jgi:hypothetical protein
MTLALSAHLLAGYLAHSIYLEPLFFSYFLTQGLALAEQVFYYLSHTSRPFCYYLFFG